MSCVLISSRLPKLCFIMQEEPMKIKILCVPGGFGRQSIALDAMKQTVLQDELSAATGKTYGGKRAGVE